MLRKWPNRSGWETTWRSRTLARVWPHPYFAVWLSWLVVSPVGQVCPFLFGWRPSVEGWKKGTSCWDLFELHGFLEQFAAYNTLPKTNSSHLKIGNPCPKRKLINSNHPFSGANSLLVSGSGIISWPARNQRKFFSRENSRGPGNILSRDTAWRLKVREVLKRWFVWRHDFWTIVTHIPWCHPKSYTCHMRNFIRTVDGRYPSPVTMWIISLFTRFIHPKGWLFGFSEPSTVCQANLYFRLVQIMNFEWLPRSIPTIPAVIRTEDTLGGPPGPCRTWQSSQWVWDVKVTVWATKWQCSLGRNENMSPIEASKISVFQLIWTIKTLTNHQVICKIIIFYLFDIICIYYIS